MSNNFTESIVIRLTREQALAVEEIAKNKNTTKTSVLRDLITSGLDNHTNHANQALKAPRKALSQALWPS
jgi:predicted DNA-binding protein